MRKKGKGEIKERVRKERKKRDPMLGLNPRSSALQPISYHLRT